MRLEFLVSWRYFATKQKERFISFISIISILGVAIGVTALIGTLGVMSGFGNQLREKIIGANAHIRINADGPIYDYLAIEEKLKKIPSIVATTENIYGQASVYYGHKTSFVLVRGINPQKEEAVTQIKQYMKAGKFFIKEREIIIGQELALQLGVDIGDTLVLGSPVTGQIQEFQVAGIFNSGYYEYDANLIIASLESCQEFFGLSQGITDIGVKIKDPYLAKEVKKDIYDQIGSQYRIMTWMNINKSLLSALRLEKIVMFLVVALVVLVASFNIISTLIVMITEKTKDIGILKALGATNFSIATIFAGGAIYLGFIGLFLGIAGGLLVCLFIKNIHKFIEIPKDIYYIDSIPVHINHLDLFWIIICAIAICFLSGIYPAWKAAKLKIADALRYE